LAGKELSMEEEQNYEGEEATFDKARDRLTKVHERLDEIEERMAKNVSDVQPATDSSTEDGG
jgi:tetrahydromethanopterin S-methyltransferase subunit G